MSRGRITTLTLLAALIFAATALVQVKSRGGTHIRRKHVAAAECITGLSFSKTERDSLLQDLVELQSSYESLRGLSLGNGVPPALFFNPVPLGVTFKTDQRPLVTSPPVQVAVPDNLEALAYYAVAQLGELIRTRRITSTQLTTMYLTRLKRDGPRLEAVITLTEELALKQARRADEEIAAGKLLDPKAIAETYYQLHIQDRTAWTQELDLRPAVEKF